jgi:hypothetical protein
VTDQKGFSHGRFPRLLLRSDCWTAGKRPEVHSATVNPTSRHARARGTIFSDEMSASFY